MFGYLSFSLNRFGFLWGERFYSLVEINRQIKEPRHLNAGALLFGMSVEDETSLKNRFVSYRAEHTRRP